MHKYYNKQITAPDNGNVQSHDQEEIQLNSTITTNSGTHIFTGIGLTAESTLKLINNIRGKIFKNEIFEMKVVPQNLVLFLNTTCNLQQLRMFLTDFFNLEFLKILNEGME